MSLPFHKFMGAAPLLSPSVDHSDENILKAMKRLKYPVLASLKKDGIRAGRFNGTLLSRTRKPIPNKSIRERSLVLPGGFDMELWSPSLDYNTIQSIVMSEEHPDSDKIEFHVLDWFRNDLDYFHRVLQIHNFHIKELNYTTYYYGDNFQWCYSASDLFMYFNRIESQNGEGICFRTPDSPYKQGRSTLKEQYLVKLCRYHTSEATIIDFIEQLENTNPLEYNSIGYADRSKSISGLVPKNTLGALVVQDLKAQCPRCEGVGCPDVPDGYKAPVCPDCRGTGMLTYNVGTGFTDAQRKEIWLNRSNYKGKIIVVKSKGHGVKEKPRSPTFKGFRNKIDIV